MKREPMADKTGILQIFGIKHYARWYLPIWAWFAGLLLGIPLLALPSLFWCDIFTVEGISL